MHAKLLQSCPTLCDPVDHSPPGSSIPGILQASIVEWVAMSSSRGASGDRTFVSHGPALDSLLLGHEEAQALVAQEDHIAGGYFMSEPPKKPINSLYCSLNH